MGQSAMSSTLATDQVEVLDWSTDPFGEPTELIRTGAAHLFAEIDQPDTSFILRLWDAAPNGKRQLITTGYLKASHRELDEERTTEGNPHHPHTRAVPVEPGAVEEYVVRLYPFGARPAFHGRAGLGGAERSTAIAAAAAVTADPHTGSRSREKRALGSAIEIAAGEASGPVRTAAPTAVSPVSVSWSLTA